MHDHAPPCCCSSILDSLDIVLSSTEFSAAGVMVTRESSAGRPLGMTEYSDLYIALYPILEQSFIMVKVGSIFGCTWFIAIVITTVGEPEYLRIYLYR
jgi:hypothetical protein